MPELPEVETIKRQLKDKIVGRKITDVEVKKQKLFQGKIADVIDVKIIDVRRRAKMLVIDLERSKNIVRVRRELLHRNSSESKNKLYLLFHLKMSGQIIYRNKQGLFGGGHPIPGINANLPNRMTHIIFTLGDNSKIFFNDQRQFGWIKVLDDKGLKSESNKYGVEPLSKEFTYNKFKNLIIRRKRSQIKPVLMDQKLIAGIGNIYASEICYMARVLPTRLVGSLNSDELKKIFLAIGKILLMAVKHRGTSTDLYVNITGEKGNYVKYLKVYGRAGRECLECKNIIKKIRQSGRGTYCCFNCQK